jgi:hypothetical protein
LYQRPNDPFSDSLLDRQESHRPSWFEPKITLGSVIQIAILIISIIWWGSGIANRVANLEKDSANHDQKLDSIEDKVDNVGVKVGDLAVAVGADTQQLKDLSRAQSQQNNQK